MATIEERNDTALFEIGTDMKTVLAAIGVLASLDTTDKSNLVAAINEVLTAASGGGAVNLDGLSDVTITGGATGHVLRREAGGQYVNVLGTDHFQAASAVLADVAAAATTAYGIDFLELTNQAGLMALLRAATTSVTGVLETATDGEALAFSATDKMVTPGNLGAIRGVANGLAGLDGGGKVPSAQLPAFVDDVLEAANFAALPGTGATGIIYVTLDDNNVYRWSGSAYVEIAASPGSTDSVSEGSTNLYYTQARADARADARILAKVGDDTHSFVDVYTTARDA